MEDPIKPTDPTHAPHALPQGQASNPDPNVWVIHVRKLHVAFILVAMLSFLGGYFVHSLTTVVPKEAVARAESEGLTQVQRLAVEVDDDPFLGPAEAPVTIVEFSDFQCPFCQRFREQTLDQLLTAYEGKVRFVYRDYPISSIHPHAQKAAEAAQCAHEQGKFWAMHDRLMAEQSAWASASNVPATFQSYADELKLNVEQFSNCLSSGQFAAEVQKDYQHGQSYGVRGTPTFFINGRIVAGAVPFSTFKAIIEEELASR